MAFLNDKEDIMSIILTQKGREKLARGKLKIKYYAFGDDEIDYQAQQQDRPAFPAAPSITGTLTIGGTLTITPGSGDVPVLSYQLYRDNVSIGSVTSGYTYTSADIVRSLTVRAVGLSGTSSNSNALQWNPTALIERWEIRDLTAGQVASFAGQKAGITFIQGSPPLRPIASQTSFNGSYAGLTFDGSDDIMSGTAGTAFTSFNSVRIVMAISSSVDVNAVLLELTPSTVNNNGAFAIIKKPDGATANTIGPAARGTVAIGNTRAAANITSPLLVSASPDTSATSGSAFLRTGGVAQTLTTVTNTCAAGNFANSNLFLGARSGSALPWGGVFGGAILILSGNLQNQDLSDAEAYVKNITGL